MKNLIPRGQVSTILLSCLSDGDKYGSELIADLQKKSDNQITLKQPTVYSTLSRLEKQGFISSYWRDSNIGGKRHYYSLTDLGKKHLLDAENVLVAKSDTKKYDEIGSFEKKDDQPLTNNGTEQENIPSNQNSFFENLKSQENKSKDDAVFLEANDMYIIPDLKKPQKRLPKKYDEIEPFEDIEQPPIHDEGIFITETLPPEQIRKVKKLDSLNLDIESNAEITKKFHKPERERSYQDKIDDLYQKMNTAPKYESVEINETINTVDELQKRYNEMQIKFYANTVNNDEVVNGFGKVPSIKVFAKYFSIFFFSVVASIMILCIGNANQIIITNSWILFCFPALLLIPAIVFLLTKNKYYKVHRKNSSLFVSLLIFIFGVIVCFSINMLVLGMDFGNFTQYLTTFIYPSVLLFGFVIGGIFDAIYAKKYC